MRNRYRPNAAAILQRADGRILIAQRSDFPECWQFPQGGIDKGESPADAVRREVQEETGLGPETYELVSQRGPYRYDFPGGPDRRGFCGQEQWYFHCRLHDWPSPPVDLAGTSGEFLDIRWVDLADFPVALAPPMKQGVYRQVLRDFFGWSEDCD